MQLLSVPKAERAEVQEYIDHLHGQLLRTLNRLLLTQQEAARLRAALAQIAEWEGHPHPPTVSIIAAAKAGAEIESASGW